MKRVDGCWRRSPEQALARLPVATVENGRLTIAKWLPYVEASARFARDLRATVTSPGNAAFGGAGGHDDPVIEVGLAPMGPSPC